ncbi:MAG: serine hydrolase domain-containing protein, partial [Flavicella sp.]
SISKTITTTAILQLWEQGKLDLDEDVSDIVGFTIRNPFHKDSPITTRQLLTHTSSIADGDSYQESYQCGVDYVSLSDWIKGYFLVGEEYYDSKQNFHSWAPGIGYKYSNVAFGLLGLIVEKVSEQPFSVYCEKHLLEPLEMHSSGWFRKDIDTLRQAKQYTSENKKDEAVAWFSKFKGKQRRGFYELCPYGFFNYPDGLFKTTVQDLSHFMKAVMQKGYYKNLSILKETTVDEMLKLQVENYDIQGLGWKKLNYESFALWGHSGRDPGVRTHLYFHQETGIGILLFQNSHEGETLKLLEAIFTLMLENEK